jgi:oxygen-dependent protoporphyrinogen oxidase
VFGAVEGGYQVLIDKLVRRSRLSWEKAAVDRIVPDGAGWTVAAADGNQWRADGVVVAVPAPRVSALLGDVAASVTAADRVPVASAVVLAIAVPRGDTLPAQSGVLVATGESLHSKAITLTSRKWGGRGDVELLRMSFGRFGDEIARSTTDEQLCEWAKADLATVFGAEFNPIDVLVHRWIDAMPQYGPGHGDLVASIRAGLPPTLALAGNYLDGVGVPACVAVAGRAAAAVAAATVRR